VSGVAKEEYSVAEFKKEFGKVKVAGKSKIRGAKSRYKNNWERMYAERLEIRRINGEIKSWKYECIRLKLADGAWYKPDFQVVYDSGKTEFHEIKGFRRTAGILRFKVAAKMYPEFTFFLVERPADQWEMTEWG